MLLPPFEVQTPAQEPTTMTTAKKSTRRRQPEPPQRGGAREGAGRPPVENPRDKNFTMRVTGDELEEIHSFGGAEWVREQLAKERKARARRAKK